MSDSSQLWNAVETLIGGWAEVLTESLETNTEPDWQSLIGDLHVAVNAASLLRDRRDIELIGE